MWSPRLQAPPFQSVCHSSTRAVCKTQHLLCPSAAYNPLLVYSIVTRQLNVADGTRVPSLPHLPPCLRLNLPCPCRSLEHPALLLTPVPAHEASSPGGGGRRFLLLLCSHSSFKAQLFCPASSAPLLARLQVPQATFSPLCVDFSSTTNKNSLI